MNVIVAFPKIENARSIKSILVKHGFQVGKVCVTGAQVLQYADGLADGIVVCASRLQDMVYAQLREYLPPGFEMLVLAPPNAWEESTPEGVVCLSMPLKVHELASSMEMMAYALERRRRIRRAQPQRRSQEEEQLIQKAKGILMERNQMTEKEAYRYLQKSSMDSGTGLTETAQMILSMMGG